MVITQNPTLAPAVQKSKYEPKVQEADVSVSSDTVKDATAFLETFFKLYPTATEKELAYYVKDGVLAPVSGDYVFSELVNSVFTKDGDNLKASVSVKYLDNKSKMTQISQYEFVLHKDWCCTIKVDIENSKGQYIEKDKQEATKDGSESTKIQHGI